MLQVTGGPGHEGSNQIQRLIELVLDDLDEVSNGWRH